MPTKRIAYYDNCKFFLIMLVVIGHFIDPYTDSSPIFSSLFLFIYSFHIPAFFFLSGMFDKRGASVEKRLNRAAYYIALYFLLKMVITLVNWAFTGEFHFSVLTAKGIPWFCLVLGVFTLLLGLLYKARLNLTVVLVISILVACFAGLDHEIGDFLCLSRIIAFFPFYLFGAIVSQEKLETLLHKKALRFAGFMVLLVFLGLCLVFLKQLYFLRSLFTGRNSFSAELYYLGPLLRVAGYAVTAVIGFAFLLVVPQSDMGEITIFGRRTMQVYFWHRPLLYVLTYLHLDAPMVSSGPAGKTVWMLVAVVMTLILSLNIFSFPTKHLQIWLQKKK